MMRTPDGHGGIELSRYFTPRAVADHRNAPVNALGYLRVMFAVDDSTTRWGGSASTARSSSPRWFSTKTCIRSATSEDRRAYSSGWRRKWAKRARASFAHAGPGEPQAAGSWRSPWKTASTLFPSGSMTNAA
jgi:hypothetical protein